MIDVIIPHWGDRKLLQRLLESLAEHESAAVLPILVDNGPVLSPNLFDEFHSLLKCFKSCEVITNLSNQGFVKGVNQGLAVADSEYIVIQNNDTRLFDNVLTRMREELDKKPEVGAIGPVMGAAKTGKGSWQSRTNLQQLGVKGMEDSVAAQHLRLSRQHRSTAVLGMIAFFCTMFRRKAMQQTGTLSSEFGLGLGDDDDYCERLRRKGWSIALYEGGLVAHDHRTSFRKQFSEHQIEKLQENAMEIFNRRKQEREAGMGRGTWPMG